MLVLGSLDLAPVVPSSDPTAYRLFLRRLVEEAPNESLAGSHLRRLVIPELDDLDRWMVVEFSARGADFRLGGQLLSPDLLSPGDGALRFLCRVAFSSASFGTAPLDRAKGRDAFGLVKPPLRSLAQRVGASMGFGGVVA